VAVAAGVSVNVAVAVAVAVGVTADVAVGVGVKRTVSSCGRRKGSGRCCRRCRSWRWAKESASA